MLVLPLIFGFIVISSGIEAMETRLYIRNYSSSNYMLTTASQTLNLPAQASYYLPLESCFELYNANDSHHLACLKHKFPTLILYHLIESTGDGEKSRVMKLEQKRPQVILLKEATMRLTDTRDIECIIADDITESKLHLVH